jgi:hypothetical protein
VTNFLIKRTVEWKTTVDISLSRISVKWVTGPFELKFQLQNKSGTDERIFIKFMADVTLFKANPKYHFLISYNRQYQRYEF